MIVKNEAHVIRRCLESVKPMVSSWAIADTGSTDGTQDIIREFMEDIPGNLIEIDWKGFSDARSRAMGLARGMGSKWILTLDADEVISGDLTGITDDMVCGNLLVSGMNSKPLPRTSIFRAGPNWSYRGRVHELPYLDGVLPKAVTIKTASIHTDSSGGRHKDPKWLFRDIQLLALDISEEPADRRNCYLMGVMLKAAGMHDDASYFANIGKEYEEGLA